MKKIAFVVRRAFGTLSARDNFCSTLYGIGNLRFNLFPLAVGVQRPQPRLRVEPVADSQPLHLFGELRNNVVENGIEDVQALDRETGLAAVKKSSNGSGADRLLQIGVVADDHRIAAAQFQRDVLERVSGGL